MQILFRPILDLQLWHDYVLGQPEMPAGLPGDYDVSPVFSLVPSEDCQRTLRNLRWTARHQPQGLTLFAEVEAIAPADPDTDFRTKIPVNRPVRLTFWLVVRDSTFANFTNLPFTQSRNQRFYFSNRSGNFETYLVETDAGGDEAVDYLFLSLPLPTYAEGDEYILGQLVTRGDSTLEALTYQNAAAATPAAADWATLPLSQYVSAQDLWPIEDVMRSLTIATANPGDTFEFTLTDVSDRQPFSETVTVPDNHPPGDAVALSLNFSGQAPGRYRLDRDGTAIDEFVLFPRLAAQKALGLIEIVLDASDPTDPFASLRIEGEDTLIQPQTYIIRFKNRSTNWRYHTQRPHGLTDAVLNPEGLTRLDDRTFATLQPVGLLQNPTPPPLSDSQRNLPFPNPARIQPVANAERRITQVFSDVYL
jgi:hypothetical protein